MKKKILITFLAIIAVVTCALCFTGCGNKLSKVKLGDTQEQVQKIMGEPYQDESSSNSSWRYYGKNYLNLLDKIEKNSKEQEKAFESEDEKKLLELLEEELKLIEQRETMQYEYTEINFTQNQTADNEKVYTVSSILFDKVHSNSENVKKDVSKIEISVPDKIDYYIDNTISENCIVPINENYEKLQYKTFFTDGSHYSAYFNGQTEILENSITYKWKDKFSEYEKTIQANKIGEISKFGFWETTDKTIKKLALPDNVQSLSAYDLKSCESLTSISVSENNKYLTIDGGFLYNKEKTTILYVPTKTNKAAIPDSVTTIGNSAFYNCTSLTSVTIGNSVTTIGGAAFEYCSSLTSITIPDSVTSIGHWVFYNCTSLTSVTIGNSVTTIGGAVFEYCSSLTSVTIPDSVTSIGWSAFAYCTSLISVTIPNSVTSISSAAFAGCTSLESVTIPNSVTFIDGAAFEYCSSLTSVTIPDSVTSIGVGAFYGCSLLKSIEYKGTMAQWSAVSKGVGWKDDTGNFTVYCTNGNLYKNGNEI